MVESLVKQVKFMLYSSIFKTILSYDQIYFFLTKECKMLINKRPVVHKFAVDSPSGNNKLDAITPEMLVYGYEIPSLAVVPHLFEDISAEECSYMRVALSDINLFETFKDLRSVQERLNKVCF